MANVSIIAIEECYIIFPATPYAITDNAPFTMSQQISAMTLPRFFREDMLAGAMRVSPANQYRHYFHRVTIPARSHPSSEGDEVGNYASKCSIGLFGVTVN